MNTAEKIKFYKAEIAHKKNQLTALEAKPQTPATIGAIAGQIISIMEWEAELAKLVGNEPHVASIVSEEEPIMKPGEREYSVNWDSEEFAGFRMFMINLGFGYAGPYIGNQGTTVIFY